MLCENGDPNANGTMQVGEIVRHAGEYCAQKDAYETDQTSNDIWSRNVGYNEAIRRWD